MKPHEVMKPTEAAAMKPTEAHPLPRMKIEIPIIPKTENIEHPRDDLVKQEQPFASESSSPKLTDTHTRHKQQQLIKKEPLLQHEHEREDAVKPEQQQQQQQQQRQKQIIKKEPISDKHQGHGKMK
ncbi:hypothetical protein Pcinc_013304 [Petrolisthes cinctipes]|uniref:Uncharacterized protein n=1 Tax=Petrolisthes cinctipes TaxID=88211 RepID=A0AAE1FYX3_PETCI|nr:hypothetical protein Pcinc_013304 [Petrolisthes cinctipes]